jgi:hypothetical protein
MSEELNEALTEGIHVDKWSPGDWATTPNYADDEWQPDIDPPRINDYAAFKKHKHYGQYFRAHRYQAFPAWVYHKTLEPKIVNSKEEVLALGPEWSPTPNKPRIDMTGKSLPVKTETQVLGEVIARTMASKQQGSGAVDPATIAAIVAAVMASFPQNNPTPAQKAAAIVALDEVGSPEEVFSAFKDIERDALIELAETNNVKVDKRWSNDRIKKELGL